jgi:hypothetical protein
MKRFANTVIAALSFAVFDVAPAGATDSHDYAPANMP